MRYHSGLPHAAAYSVLCNLPHGAFKPLGKFLTAFTARRRRHAGGIDPAPIRRVVLELVIGFAFKAAEIQFDECLKNDRNQRGIQ